MKALPLWLKLAIGLALVLGVSLRFINLNKKIFWIDEVSTAWAVSGYSEKEVAAAIATGQPLHAADVLRYQHGAAGRSWQTTVRVLATSDAVHPPLFYLMLRSWRQLFGASIGVTRSFSALLSLLLLAGVYCLCLELFGSALAGWLAAALIALSPFHLYYAQEAREYVLVTALMVLSSVALLRARRIGSAGAWLLYAASILAGLYTSLLFFATVMVHAAYVFATSARPHDRKAVRNFVFCAVPVVAASVPWLWTVATHRQEVASGLAWFGTPVTSRSYVAHALSELGGLFLWAPWSLRDLATLGIALLVLVAYSLRILLRDGPRDASIFISLLIAIPTLPLLAYDILFGGSRLLIGRYIELAFLGFDLSVAYLFARCLNGVRISARIVPAWQAGVAALLLCSAASCVKESSSPTAWDSQRNAYVVGLGQLLDRAAAPLLVSDVYKRNVLDVSVLSNSLTPQVAIAMVNDPKSPPIAGYQQVFVLNPSPQLLRRLSSRLRNAPQSIDASFPVFAFDPNEKP